MATRSKRRQAIRPQLVQLETRDVPAVFFVENTDWNVATEKTLPWAIAQSNATDPADGPNTIIMHLPTTAQDPGETPGVIRVTSGITITNPVTITRDYDVTYARPVLFETPRGSRVSG